MKAVHIALLVGGGLLLFRKSYTSILKAFLSKWEGFSPVPYWDVSRWSWGYGTKAPGATGTITREQAMNELLSYTSKDHSYLQSRITRRLNANQWAALLSFSYNLGTDDAIDLLPYINSGNLSGLKSLWLQYFYADGQPSNYLKSRRQAEINLFTA